MSARMWTPRSRRPLARRVSTAFPTYALASNFLRLAVNERLPNAVCALRRAQKVLPQVSHKLAGLFGVQKGGGIELNLFPVGLLWVAAVVVGMSRRGSTRLGGGTS